MQEWMNGTLYCSSGHVQITEDSHLLISGTKEVVQELLGLNPVCVCGLSNCYKEPQSILNHVVAVLNFTRCTSWERKMCLQHRWWWKVGLTKKKKKKKSAKARQFETADKVSVFLPNSFPVCMGVTAGPMLWTDLDYHHIGLVVLMQTMSRE